MCAINRKSTVDPIFIPILMVILQTRLNPHQMTFPSPVTPTQFVKLSSPLQFRRRRIKATTPWHEWAIQINRIIDIHHLILSTIAFCTLTTHCIQNRSVPHETECNSHYTPICPIHSNWISLFCKESRASAIFIRSTGRSLWNNVM